MKMKKQNGGKMEKIKKNIEKIKNKNIDNEKNLKTLEKNGRKMKENKKN